MLQISDPGHFRSVLGHYPTGICVITAIDADNSPVGMVVGSFTSVSLEPPLVAFFPDKKSVSWRRIAHGGGFCVNVLSALQGDVCRLFASKSKAKFEHLSHRLSASGRPILDDVIAWIDCRIHAVHEAGDHYIAIGQVDALDVEKPGPPLLFFKGGYGSYSPQKVP